MLYIGMYYVLYIEDRTGHALHIGMRYELYTEDRTARAYVRLEYGKDKTAYAVHTSIDISCGRIKL